MGLDRSFARWRDAPGREPLPRHAREWLQARLGTLQPRPPRDPATIEVPPPSLPGAVRAVLVEIVGADHVRTDRLARLRHSAGSAYTDLLRQREGHGLHPPDAVVSPGTEAEVLALLRAAADHDLVVVPAGGGTSVVGGVEPGSARGDDDRPRAVIDLSRLNRLVDVDPVSRTASFEPGVTGPQAEELLTPYGLTVGHVPQSYERATLGGYAATRSSGQSSTGFGRFDDLVVSARLATPRGVLAAGTGTPNAAGPDVLGLIVGSEGVFGVITEVTTRVRPMPEQRRYEGWMVPGLDTGFGVLRALVQEGEAPDVTRLSDQHETEVQFALRGPGISSRALHAYLRARKVAGGCLVIVGWEGTAGSVRARRRAAVRRLRSAGAVPLGRPAGEAWHRHRFAAPYQRDDLLDAGVLVETVETATTWSRVPGLYAAVRAALHDVLAAQGTAPVIMTHLSHLYPSGASLYFTVLARRASGDTAAGIAQWRQAKAAANDAITKAGATISHHHAVGREHAPWLTAEIGDLGRAVLRETKHVLDPEGVLNPGVLFECGGQ